MSESFPEYAIIVAGGTGTRMQSDIPKQFIPIGSKPVIMHTMERFYEYNPTVQIIVVLPSDQIRTWESLCHRHVFAIKHQVVVGGTSRFSSVKNGIAAITVPDGVVAVHDGVRPFVSVDIIRQVFKVAATKGNAVVAVSLKESIRKLLKNKSKSVDRNQYQIIQTPQCFRLPLLRQAYELPEEPTFTDDASVVERFGQKIYLVKGNYENIKITTPEDLIWAETFLKMKS